MLWGRGPEGGFQAAGPIPLQAPSVHGFLSGVPPSHHSPLPVAFLVAKSGMVGPLPITPLLDQSSHEQVRDGGTTPGPLSWTSLPGALTVVQARA